MRILEEALTFDDVLLVPASSDVLAKEIDLGTQLTRTVRLGLPILSAAMDTVTEARLAITMAQEGGMGIIHKNMNIEAQAREVARVKKFESGVIRDPISVLARHDHPRSAGAHALARHLRRAGGARASRRWASSRTATCASRRRWMRRCHR